MGKIFLVLQNYKLLAFCSVLFVYFYFMLQNFLTGSLSSIAIVCVFFMVVGSLFCIKCTQSNKLARKLTIWFFWSLFLCVIYFNSIGQTTSSILWISAFFCSYTLVNTRIDVKTIVFFASLICLVALFYGVTTLNIASFINISFGNNDYDVNENIGMYVLITVPFIMLLSNRIIKWLILIGIMIVVLLSARRTATICFILILILNIINEFKTTTNNKGVFSRYLLPIILIASVIYGIQMLLTGDFASAFERTINRFLEIKDDSGSGRTVIYKAVLDSFGSSNIFEMIFGHGYLGVNRVIGRTAAHNDFLEYLYDFGIVGLFFYTYLHVFFIKRVVFLYRKNNNLCYSYAASYCVFLFYGMFGNIIIYPQYFITLPVFWGAAEKLINRNIQYD